MTSGRFIQLDSLRGIAAMSVVLFHVTASNLDFFVPGNIIHFTGDFYKDILLFSPIRLFFAGAEAVWLFFLLSGFVLIRTVESSKFQWTSYFASRLVRLYLPVFFAVCFTFVMYRAISHSPTELTKHFMELVPTNYGVTDAVKDSILITGTGFANGPLWSLQWEIFFSMLLPIYFVLAKIFPKSSLFLCLVSIALSSKFQSLFLLYMPMFMIGALLGMYWVAVSHFFTKFLGTNHFVGTALMLLALVSSASGYILIPFDGLRSYSQELWYQSFFAIIKVLGLALLIVMALWWNPLKYILSAWILRGLGIISFSLYLTHGPTYIAVAFLVGPGLDSAIIGVLASIAVAVVFYLIFEKTSHKMSRRVSSFVGKRMLTAEEKSVTE